METIFAVINSGKVENIIVAKLEFIESLKLEAVDVTNMNPRPSVGSLYDGKNFTESVRQQQPKENAKNYLRELDLSKLKNQDSELQEILKKLIEAVI